MNAADVYVDIDNNRFALWELDAKERQLIERIRKRMNTRPHPPDFEKFWQGTIKAFYRGRSVRGEVVRRTLAWRIATDLSRRLERRVRYVPPRTYRVDVENLIRRKFGTRRAFCEATGLTESALSRVLAGHRELSLRALHDALAQIGYRLAFVKDPNGPPKKPLPRGVRPGPLPKAKQPGKRG